MTIEFVKSEIAAFLANPEPSVLCLRGRWGVGKTHAWNEQLAAARTGGSLTPKRYAYVSLFGINSIEALKFAIIENNLGADLVAPKGKLRDMASAVAGLASKAAANSPLLARFIDREATRGLLFASVFNQIICIDDFERRGDGLMPKDVLGLLTSLKEQRSCKVALILNDESLEAGDRTEFETHLEKAVDISLLYEPSPVLAASIGAGGQGKTRKLVADCAAALEISNIRTVKRAVRLAEDVERKLSRHDPQTIEAAVKSLVLFCWCRDEPQDAPSFAFVEAQGMSGLGLGGERKKNRPENEMRWVAKLQRYGYMWTDDFDKVLIEGVRKGYFDAEKLEREASASDAKLERDRAHGSLETAFRTIDHSFDDDLDAVLAGIRKVFEATIEHVAMGTLNSVVQLFKRFGREEEAVQMIERYVTARGAEPGLFDLDANPFGSLIDDPDLRKAFAAKDAEPRETPDFLALLESPKEAWTTDTIETLAAAPEEDCRRAFKSRRGDAHKRLIINALHFHNVGGTTPAMQAIARKAVAALREVAKESPLNAFRVTRFGVSLLPEPEEAREAAMAPLDDPHAPEILA